MTTLTITPEADLETPQVAVSLHVARPCGTVAQPIAVGVPFPRGALASASAVQLLNAGGQPVPLQAEPLARWSDGSVKWLLLDFVLGAAAPGDERWTLRQAGEPAVATRSARPPDRIDTGAAVFHVARAQALPLARVLIDGTDALHSARIVLTDARGKTVTPRVERCEVEARGPVRTTLRLEGPFPGRARLRFVARVSFFTGTGLVCVRLTLHNPNRAHHRCGLWDLGDPGSVRFHDLSLELTLPEAGAQVCWTAETGRPPRFCDAKTLELYQDSSGGENWRSRNHANGDGRVPCSFRGYRLRHGVEEEAGLRASPVVMLRGDRVAVAAAVPEFWQQFPKAVEVENNVLRVRLFPRQWNDLFELQGGEQKTHTVWLHFGPAATAQLSALAWVHTPARVHAAPGRIAPPADDEATQRFDALVSAAVTGPASLLARREIIDEYGWRHYGEIYADHEAAHYRGEQPILSHYNNQYDVVYGALLQFGRTGDPRWLDLLEPLARHVIDVDIYHTTRDRAAYSGGLFWHTDHYRDAATSTHRAYSRANCRPGDRAYGGGPSNEHNYTTGLLHYYYLTGDPQARDAVLGLADWVLAMDDGRRTVFGPVDDGPTGRASCTRDLAYQGPGRGAGNSINGLLDAWLLSGQRHYLDYAETLIRRCIHPEDDIAARDLLNVEERWSYTVFLSVLARYLDLKAEAGALDGTHAYARASLLRYAAWMVEHEEPYLAHPEKLEYPTETWAAQDLRKANVLRLAARYATEPLHTRLLRRGEELAELAWRDLLRFESRTGARPLALVMIEGLRDLWLRVGPPAPAPAVEEPTFPAAERFVPQRLRVMAQLKSVRGIVGLLFRRLLPV